MQKFNYIQVRKHISESYTEFFKKFIYRSKINSTNIYANKLTNIIPHNFIVLADYQTGGKGRFNRKWISPPNNNLYFSIVLQNKYLYPYNTTLFITAYTILKTLQEFNSNFKIKWPNDIIFKNKKISGVLIENIYNSKKLTSSIIGIGININSNFSKIKTLNAVSLKDITKKNHNREKIFLNFLHNFVINYRQKEKAFYLWRKNLAFLNKKIIFHQNDSYISGIFKNVDNNGNIIIETKKKQKKYNLGEILL